MPYRVVYKPGADRDVDKLPPHVLPRLREAIAALGANPRPPGCKLLRGKDRTWRIRVSDYRVLYQVDDTVHVIRVVRAGHRRDIYDR
jgi:mRNA interferase RelE/StbE